jgi:hypothetical protein
MSDGPALSNLSTETRHFDPPAELAANANVTAAAYEGRPADVLGDAGASAGLGQGLGPGAAVGSTVRQVVRRR